MRKVIDRPALRPTRMLGVRVPIEDYRGVERVAERLKLSFRGALLAVLRIGTETITRDVLDNPKRRTPPPETENPSR